MSAWMVGIDTGGTFTDLIAFEVESQEFRVAKVHSVPEDPSTAVLTALRELFSTGVRPEDIAFLVHGTTVATNAILEGKGVRAGLLITEGFRAVYEARGWVRPGAVDLIDTFYQKPPLLVPQHLTEEIRERVNFAGEVVTPLDEGQIRKAVRRLKVKGVEAVAVCYLFSFLYPDHEERTEQIIREEAPELRVSLSCRVLPVIREYVRLSTTVVDAYVGPIIERYLLRFTNRLNDEGTKTRQIYLMQSNGGLMRMTVGARFPNQTLLSGPAAGVVAGLELANLSGLADVVTFDMGGTSTDISVIAGGGVNQTSEGRIAGQDIGTPMLEVRTLGAGGGAVAWIGADGLLKVGPHSAGADPGPACYGRGGKEPTVTDANLLLGALSPESILAGRMALDQDLARAAIRQVAMRLGLDVLEVAAGILRVVNNNMAIELRLALQERGHDPRKFVLVAFGGAGPLHAGLLARALNIPRVLVPRHPGITSAAGLLQTQVRHFYLQSAVGLLSQFPVGRMNEVFDQLESRARQDANEEGFAGDVLEISRQVDLRYLHQGYHLTVDCSADPLKGEDKPKLRRAFDNLHQRLYGQSAPNEEAEVVTFRLVSQVSVPRLHLPEIEVGDESAEHAVRGQRQLFELERGAFVAARVYDRARLLASNRLRGPAIVEEFDSTTVVLAGQEVRIDRYGNLIIETGATA